MTTHRITLDLTTSQLIHLNNALSEHKDANKDAIESEFFHTAEKSNLLKQCEALQIFMDSISNLLDEAHNA